MQNIQRVVLIDVVSPLVRKEDAIKNLGELKSLVATYNGVDIVDIIQHRTHPDGATFIGSGKVTELAEIVKKRRIDIIILNAIVNPSVLFNLTQRLWNDRPQIQVWDRVGLILNIFDKHAHTAEAKLQIEIAKILHMGPRIYGLGLTYFSRQSGGINTKGQGETNIELMKRHWKIQIKKKNDELEKLLQQHLLQLERRKAKKVQSISIVGYTNAGKTSLFNLLARKHKDVRSALFVTLDTVTGKLYFPSQKKEAIVSDTIGFIKDLPSSLISSFKSTLMESVHADLILHLIDITDPDMNQKIKVVEEILRELKVHAKHITYVFNKIDVFTGDGEAILKSIHNNYSHFSPQFISATTNFGIEKLKKQIENNLFIEKT